MIGFVFPGQGSQAAGMGKDLAEAFPVCRRTFQEADEALGMAISRLCFEGPDSELQLTAVAQPAILAASVAAWRALAEAGIAPRAVAGHSLGEYSALVAAGSLDFGDALRLVRRRGLYMQEAVPVGEGSMAAILGLDRETLEEVCRQAREEQGAGAVAAPANLNAPGQVVISGHTAAVDRAVALAQQRGARRAVRLQVSAPFHCELMRPAAERLAADLEAAAFADPAVAVVTNVDARPVRTGAEARRALAAQVTAPVRWEESVMALGAMGVTRAVEVGPGRVLCGLIKRIEAGVSCAAGGDVPSITALKEGPA
ncbi:MAG TPA: ACP S-malonyltransferase [Candidatus Polarisedimenticolia bacterium]|nr:ACP S-malonyltransferase [Candidatus Polarisedimenticolia bacterium]